MTGWLLDTNVLSELRRPAANAQVVAFISNQPLDQLFISSVALAEPRYGIERMPDQIRRLGLQDWLANQVRPMFSGRVLPVDEDVILRWRLLVAEGREAGHTFAQPDLFIAATALLHGLTLVSRNVKDFARSNVPLHNPWLDPAPHASAAP